MKLTSSTLLLTAILGTAAAADTTGGLTYGPRPAYLISQMADSPLKDKLLSCADQTPMRSDFSIGHRGAPLMFPEHTVESNVAAAQMGAGILECDVTFTADHQLVCRHAQNDLHTTTNIVTTDLADKCTTPFAAANGDTPASAECRTSDLTLAEFQTLAPKMDAANAAATTAEEYLGGTADWRTDLYTANATLMTHADSIALFRDLGAKFTPELKSASVDMPHNGFSQEDYAQAMINEYKAAGIPASDVWAQSFDLNDVLYWIENEPEFGEQAVYLMDEYDIEGYSPQDPATWPNTMAELKAMGINFIAPPLWMLLTLENGEMVPSALSVAAKEADLEIITWTLERSGPLRNGGGWYYQTVTEQISQDGDYFKVLDVLAQDVEIAGMFSDWPATTTYYANCMGL
jgi:glycerophosphoryl diester phosphodiesterase